MGGRAALAIVMLAISLTGNRALTAVLDQYLPVLRRAERLRFSSRAGLASGARHDVPLRASR